MPIKFVLGDYFLAELDKQIFCFKIDGSRIKTYRHTLVRSFTVLHYDTTHYLPISPGDNKELELVLKENALPKMNHLLFGMLKLLGKREKKQFQTHDLNDLVAEVAQHENEYGEQVTNLKNYLASLNINQIVTPVRSVVDFIEGDLLATDPKFLGDIVSAYQRTDVEHKKITNSAITGKVAWMKVIAILAIIVIIIAIGVMVWQSGMLSHGIPGLSLPNLNAPTPTDLMHKYPTPESLKAAIDRGEIKYGDLPPDIQKMVDTVKIPTVQANP